jgi:hypothetical protein
MDADRFDSLARSLAAASSRRRALASSFGGLIALATLPVDAKKGKTKKPNKNAFGCVDVGKACAGKDSNCCSGVCQGKKPKKGKKDKSKCQAHNAGTCTQNTCAVGVNVPCNPANPDCFCVSTTGDANFCGNFTIPPTSLCRVCRKDTDCEAEFGQGAACIVLGGVCSPFCPTTSGTACAPACAF